MNNIELFKKLLITTKRLHDRDEKILNAIGVQNDDFNNELDGLLELGHELLNISTDDYRLDEYYFTCIDVLLNQLSLELALDKIKELTK